MKKTSEYAVEPSSVLYALQGQAIHSINESHTQGNILSEERLKDDITSGQFDLFGKIIDADDGVLGDLKVTSSYKLMKALGIYKVDVPTGEVYKTGAKKGQPKTRKEFRFDGVKDVFEWAIQLNCKVSKSIECLFKLSVAILIYALRQNVALTRLFTSFLSTKFQIIG